MLFTTEPSPKVSLLRVRHQKLPSARTLRSLDGRKLSLFSKQKKGLGDSWISGVRLYVLQQQGMLVQCGVMCYLDGSFLFVSLSAEGVG